MSLPLQTERLSLRLWTENDAAVLWKLNEDPDILRFTGDVNFESIDATREFLLKYDQYKKFKMGRFIMELKATGEVLGWCGLKYIEDEKKVDLGYRIFKEHWNKGYATEAAAICIRYGFETLKLPRITAVADVRNLASIRVMQKLGMKFSCEKTEDGNTVVEYEIFWEPQSF